MFVAKKSKKKNRDKRKEEKYILKILKIDKFFVTTIYMDHIAKSEKKYKHQMRKLYLYNCNNNCKKLHTFKHLLTFGLLAMKLDSK